MSISQQLSSYRVVIIGRPNVGKSTLFNRLIGRKRALVHNLPGVTRDRLEEQALWWIEGKQMPVWVTDTGGLGGPKFSIEIEEQVQCALNQAHITLFVMDSQSGLTTQDKELLRKLQKSGLIDQMPVIAVVNKVDIEIHESQIADFFQMGLDSIQTISAEHGRGIDDLKETIAKLVQFSSSQADQDAAQVSQTSHEVIQNSETETRIPKIAMVGRPNVGKSTLLNAILGETRVITSPIAGTTVDSVDVPFELQGKPFLFIDTAGIRRKSKTEQGVEVLSVVQTRKTLEKADIAILVLDGESGISDQDEKIGGLIEEAGCSLILALNKWDTQSGNQKFTKKVASTMIRQKMAYLKYAPILFTSGLKGQGLEPLGELLTEILHQRKFKMTTHEFTEWVRMKSTVHNPANAKFYLCHQTGRRPPTFICHVNDPAKIHFSLKRHLVNALRKRWGYMGSPVRLLFIEAKNRRSLPKRVKNPMLLPSQLLPSKKKISGKSKKLTC